MAADNQTSKCPILLSPIKTPVMTGCGHLCEKSALNTWINSQPAHVEFPQCPSCHVPMDCNELVEGEDFVVGATHVFIPKISLQSAPTPVNQAERLTCPIGLAPIKTPVMTGCSHIFESSNLNSWIDAQPSGNNAPCPVCRAAIIKSDLILGEDISEGGIQSFEPKEIMYPDPVTANNPWRANGTSPLPRPRPQSSPSQRVERAHNNTRSSVNSSHRLTEDNFTNPALMFSSFARAIQHGASMIDTIMNPRQHQHRHSCNHNNFGGGMIGLIFRNIFSTIETVLKVCTGMADFMAEHEEPATPRRNNRNRFRL